MTRKVKGKQVKKGPKKVIILTGPSGSGKSTVARMLSRRGWSLIKGDEIARGLYAPGKPAFRRLRQLFGEGIVKSGRIDRKALGAMVFSSPKALHRLNGVLHPLLIREIKARLRSLKKACVDMAVYFAAGAADFGGPVVIVDAPLKARIARLKARGLSPERARTQARSLKFGKGERRRSQAILHNTGTQKMLKAELERALGRLF